MSASLPQGPLPLPDADERARSDTLRGSLLEEIDREGFLPFERFMERALYTPALGYYAAGTRKFGAAGDFVTAPELTPLFGASVAAFTAHCLEAGVRDVVELGPGSGALAADILLELERGGSLPSRYRLLEVSAALQARQRETLSQRVPHLLERVQWLEGIPDRIEGVVLGNEVLDALPVALVERQGEVIFELGVARECRRDALTWARRPAQGELLAAAVRLSLPEGYRTEIHLQAQGLVRTLGAALRRGALLFLDYGFPQREYYHPQRSGGTLVCHYRQRIHADPLQWVGLQDISTHLDFSALADAGRESQLDLLGYTTQAHFLIDCGILDRLAAIGPENALHYAKAAAGVQKLLSPSEMGELVKAIVFGRGMRPPVLGLRSGDRSGRL